MARILVEARANLIGLTLDGIGILKKFTTTLDISIA